MQGPETRPTLIGKLADPSSEVAWEEFVRLYHGVIYRVACARGLQHADAEDVVQDVFATVGRKIGAFDCEAGGSFRGWLGKLARDASIDRLRKTRFDVASGDSAIARALHDVASEDQAATIWELELQRERLRLACNVIRDDFSETAWQSFWLTAIAHHTIADTAVKLGVSQGSVRVARCRVMARLKKEVLKHDSSRSL